MSLRLILQCGYQIKTEARTTTSTFPTLLPNGASLHQVKTPAIRICTAHRADATAVYGLVFRYDLGIMVGPDKPSPTEPHGEWRSMGESNVLLSKLVKAHAFNRGLRVADICFTFPNAQVHASERATARTSCTKQRASPSRSYRRSPRCGPGHSPRRAATRSARP